MTVQAKGEGRGVGELSALGGRNSAPAGAIALQAQGSLHTSHPGGGHSQGKDLTPPALCRGPSPPQKKQGTLATAHGGCGVLPRVLHSTEVADGKQQKKNPKTL